MVLRVYCRIAAVVFLLFTVYPLITKLLEHRLAHDWTHGLLHLVSAAIGIYAGWFARSHIIAAIYTWTIAIVYTALGIGGWFIDGLFLGTIWAIPLAPVDHAFHLLLGLAAVAVLLVDRQPAAQPPAQSD